MAVLRKKMMEISGAIHKKNEKLFLLKQNEIDPQSNNF